MKNYYKTLITLTVSEGEIKYLKDHSASNSKKANVQPFTLNSSHGLEFNDPRMSLYTAQKIKFSIKDFFRKCDQIRKKLWIWSHLLKKSLLENVIFCAVLGLGQTPMMETFC